MGATAKHFPRKYLVQLFYGSTQKWENSAKAIKLTTHILF